ncbi:MAG TPA: M36 family metallopeptidase [Thermoanaerobaculia bacterium]|nr:M36 family metallopeptidase [Thermoanaerobaculia bacterium]
MRSVVLFGIALLFAGSAFGKDLPNIDALFHSKPNPEISAAIEQKVGQLNRDGLRIQAEERLGVPTFLWLDASQLSGRVPIGNGAERAEIAAARGILHGAGNAYGHTGTDATSAVVEGIISTGRGPVIVKFSQQVDGIAIFREELNVVMDQRLNPVAISGYISSQATPVIGDGWARSETAAASDALKNLTELALNASQLTPAGSRDGYDFFTLTSSAGVELADPVRMKKVYFHLPEGLIPAYYIETSVVTRDGVSSDGVFVGNKITDSYSYVISAIDGSILFRKNLTEEHSGSTTQNALPPGGFTYRVWADPVTGIPYDTPAGNGVHPKINPIPDGGQHAFVAQADVTLPNYPFSMNDPWVAPGATQTVGNNADAYLDLFGSTDAQGNPTTNDGLAPIAPPADPPTGDFRADITAPDQFLHSNVPDTNHATAEARQSAIQQLFYNINFLHDWFYDAGFTEAMRNAQTNNFGRGGLQNDNIRSEVQDYSGFSNANMSTPSDGARPRMQMYNFPNKSNVNEIIAPASIAGLRAMGVGMQGPQTFDVTADVVMATFDGANNVTNAAALAGKIAMFDFTGAFSARITNLTATSAVGILMVWQSGASANAVVNITGFNTVWTKPLSTISFNSAAPIKTQLAVPNTVTMRMHRFADRDGTLDNQIVFHEWGHYLSNRLVSNSAGLSNNQGRSMGEGWGDFTAMMLTVREDDTATPSNATWGGVYAIATYATSGVNFSGAANHGYYLGIRRTPYSTDMTNYNAFTFKHIMNGVPLPVGPPVASGGVNAQVHNSGEVWANMLWECYSSLLRDTQGALPRLTFQQAQDRMKTYLVASLAMTPPAPTYVEARDAVLAAAYATDYTDYLLFWAAYAKRGMGVGAIAPDRASTTHAGVVESFVVAPDAMVVNSATLLDDSVASCDADGVLDTGEYGKLTVAIKNVGSTTLNATTATIASTNPGVSFPNGTTINFPSSEPLSTVSSQITVALNPGVAGVQQIDFQITLTDPAITGSRNGTASFRANTDIIPASSATDDVEASTMATTPWTLDFEPVLGDIAPFSIQTVTPLSHRWFGPNGGAPSDNRLVSPVFTVDGSGSVTMQFDHTWSFENLFDGGVIEMQVNGGAWPDVGTNGGGTTGCYNATPLLIAGGTNPLNGRPAFTGTQNASQHCTITRAIAPGSTVRFRFRTGADDNTAGTGWRIDNIAFSGVVETPFPTLVSDTACVIPSSTSLTTSANPSPFGSSLTLTATVTSAGGTPTGTVTFFDGATNLGTVALASGVASLSTSSLSLGLHNLTATYSGDAGYAASASASVSQTISKIATSVVVGSSNNPSALGSPVTFTATVSATSGTPGGSVTFLDGATPLATVTLSGGVAMYTTSALTGGAHTINATYGGNGTYFSSTGSVTQYVDAPSFNFAPATYYALESAGTVTLTITRTGGNTSGPGSVSLATADGTAVNGVRYTGTETTVNFAGGETSQTVNIALINTSAIEGMQNFTATISTPVGGLLGATVVATVNIVDDDTINSDFSSPSDGKRDIVWRNGTTGDTRVWEMNNTLPLAPTSFTTIENRGAPWVLVGIADFNADGNADILWRSSVTNLMEVWYMTGLVHSGTAAMPGSPDPNWRVVATGDFNGDGFADIVWRHATTFAASVWLMRDTTVLSISALPTVPDANWNIMGLGDFNRDKKLDIVWRNSMSKGCAVWLMNGVTFSSAVILPSVGAPWNLVGVGDMNGDGDADMIWQTTTTRQVAIWRMNQTTFVSGHFIDTSGDLTTANDPNYNIVAPK